MTKDGSVVLKASANIAQSGRGIDGAVAFICYEGKGRPKPALPKACTTLVPRRTIEAGTDQRIEY